MLKELNNNIFKKNNNNLNFVMNNKSLKDYAEHLFNKKVIINSF